MGKSITFDQLYDKLGKQPCRNMHETVKLNIDVRKLKNILQLEDSAEICLPLTLRFSKTGKPYFSVGEKQEQEKRA